ncbi:hypothetical protein D3C72_2494280 [compost metagenome]
MISLIANVKIMIFYVIPYWKSINKAFYILRMCAINIRGMFWSLLFLMANARFYTETKSQYWA